MFQGVINTIRSWVRPGIEPQPKDRNTASNGSPVRPVNNQSYLSGMLGYAAKRTRLAWNNPSSLLSRAASKPVSTMHWLAENRFGVAKLIGKVLIPSQHHRYCNLTNCSNFVNDLVSNPPPDGSKYEIMTIEDNKTKLKALICYPPGYNPAKEENSRCIVFNNPNGMLLAEFITEHKQLNPHQLPGFLQKERKCPVIFYDYRGTGLNKSPDAPSSTNQTIIQDGCAVLKHALDKFVLVEVVGSSLGGGVATVSLEKVLSSTDILDRGRVSLVSHDSFTSAPQVVLPGMPRLANAIGWLVGGGIDAAKSMKKLIRERIPITVMNNQNDPVIRKGSRMSEFLRDFKTNSRITVVENTEVFENGHCGFGDKFRNSLTRPDKRG
ncbi:hypothetical protein EOPP23_15760 [Endozoicomonas sp. OPT23]|uniref:alpha/beta fold hydrolase n=1 Tax=Endozoicomonas sp. OPT23 TaxID=2072845 RepID=UPI00129C01C8|nr:alpha/beta hydrolase [Endozoicomonas sp. OPT23]MRI34445.1 hypothetical protein [Endozoicomonas sp. OPT23]